MTVTMISPVEMTYPAAALWPVGRDLRIDQSSPGQFRRRESTPQEEVIAGGRVKQVQRAATSTSSSTEDARSDAGIARAATVALEHHDAIPSNVHAAANSGYVVLTGTVDWQYQKNKAENAVRYIKGVEGVINNIQVASHAA